MSIPTPAQQPASLYGVAVGAASTASFIPVVSTRAPTSVDVNYKIGQQWIKQLAGADTVYQLTSLTPSTGLLSANWLLTATVSSDLNTLTDTAGTVITPDAGNIQIAGTANQISSTAGSHLLTLAVPSAFIAPGSIASTTTISSGTTMTAGTGFTVTTGGATITAGGLTVVAGGAAITGTTTINTTGAAVTSIGTGGTGATNIGNATGNTAVTGSLTASTTLTATLGAITATNGNLVLGTAGNKILSTSVATTTTGGANSFGSVTLVGGTATIATSAVTANSLIVIWRQSIGATGAAALGQLTVGTITGSTSFVINAALTATATSLATTDVSVVGWMIIN